MPGDHSNMEWTIKMVSNNQTAGCKQMAMMEQMVKDFEAEEKAQYADEVAKMIRRRDRLVRNQAAEPAVPVFPIKMSL
jgi:hypothetical protein